MNLINSKKTILAMASFFAFACAQAADKPARILLITGGCCHEYSVQKDLLKDGLEKRLHVEVTQIHSDDASAKPPLPNHGNPAYADGYDLVMHDECAAGISDPEVIAAVLAPHQAGLPGVNLHCAMHSYRFGNIKDPVSPDADNAGWFNYLGLQTIRHGPHRPISFEIVDPGHPANSGLVNWTTGNEELYHVIQIMPGSHVLAKGVQAVKSPEGQEIVEEHVVTWAHTYGPAKARVWSTTMGHYSATVQDDRYLDMVANGVVWALNRDDVRK